MGKLLLYDRAKHKKNKTKNAIDAWYKCPHLVTTRRNWWLEKPPRLLESELTRGLQLVMLSAMLHSVRGDHLRALVKGLAGVQRQPQL